MKTELNRLRSYNAKEYKTIGARTKQLIRERDRRRPHLIWIKAVFVPEHQNACILGTSGMCLSEPAVHHLVRSFGASQLVLAYLEKDTMVELHHEITVTPAEVFGRDWRDS